MTMLAQLRTSSAFAARRLALIAALGLVGLFVGVGSVLLPIGIPVGVVAIAGLLLLWVMPDLRTVPERLMHITYYPFIVSVLCIPNYYALVFSGLPWISFRRSILFAFLFPTVITIAGSSRHRSKIASVLRSSKLLSVLLIGYLIILFFSTLTSTQLTDSINNVTNQVLGWMLPFVATIMIVKDERDINRLLRVFVCCVLFDFALGLIEFKLQRPFLFLLIPPHMRDLIIAGNPRYSVLLLGQGVRNGLYRASSIYNISLSWGEMGAIMAPIAAFFITEGRTKSDNLFGIIGLSASLLSIVLSGARGAYVGFTAAMLPYLIAWAIRQVRIRPGSLKGPMSLTFGSMFAMGTTLAIMFVAPIRRAVLGGSETQSSNDARAAQWALAKPKILARPLWGYGPGTSSNVIDFHIGNGATTVDSSVYSLLVDSGIPGFVLFFGLFLCAAYLGVKDYVVSKSPIFSYCNSLSCACIAYIVYRTTLNQQENSTLIFIIVGLLLSIYKLSACDKRSCEEKKAM